MGSKETMSRKEAEATLLETPDLLGDDTTSDAFRAGVLLLMGVGRRKDVSNLTRDSKYPKDFVKRVRKNLLAGGIWKHNDKLTYCEWDSPKHGNTAFVLDAMCGAGWVVRVPDNKA